MWCNIAINRSNTAVKRRRTSGRQVLSSSHNEFSPKSSTNLIGPLSHGILKPHHFVVKLKTKCEILKIPLVYNKLRVEKSRVFSFPNFYFYLQISLINSIFCAYSALQRSFLLLSFEILHGK